MKIKPLISLISLLLVASVTPIAFAAADVTQTAQTVQQFALDGTLIQGALLHGKVAPNSSLELNGDKVKIASDGSFVIGFGRDAKLHHQLTLNTVDGTSTLHDLTLSKRDYKISRITGIAKKITQPNAASIKRARLDSKQVRAARAIFSTNQHFKQSFIWPVKGRISGVYGSQRFYNGKAGRPHFGVDIAMPTGTVVVAPADGIIRLFVPDMFYSGGTLIIDHGMGVSSSFLHLSAGLVKAGDIVKQGQPVAKIGSSGRATGPHLDWRMNWLNQRVDPQLLVPPM